MQRFLAIAVLLVGSSFLMAANPPASSPDKPPANPASAEPQGPPPPPPMTGTLEGATPGSDGLLFKSMGWDKYREKSRVSFYGYIQTGISTNSTIKKGDQGEVDAVDGYNTGPGAIGTDATGIIGISDTDQVSVEQLELWIERGIRGNLVPGVTPTPGPMYKHFDWGFSSEVDYGRAQNPCRMTGFDMNWPMNPSAQNDTFNRYNWFCEPTAQFDLYFPVLKGIALRIGRQPDQTMTDEIPPQAFFSPNNFYSHAYSMTRAHQQLGARIFAMVMHSHQYGYATAEFMVEPNAQQSTHSLNGSPNYNFGLRYRTPKMDTWVDYTGRFGPGEDKLICATAGDISSCNIGPSYKYWNGQLANDHLFSATHQMFFENALQITHEFSPKWKADILFQFGKQFGDGADTTVATYTPAGPNVCGAPSIVSVYEYSPTVIRPDCRTNFTGASFDDITFHVTYSFNKKLNASFRIEQMHDPNGYFGEPPFSGLSYPSYTGLSATSCSSGDLAHQSQQSCYYYEGPPVWNAIQGAHNEVTGGINYNPNVHFRIRPEIRYDWQSGSYGIPAFGQNNLLIYNTDTDTSPYTTTSSSQVTAAVDTVLYF